MKRFPIISVAALVLAAACSATPTAPSRSTPQVLRDGGSNAAPTDTTSRTGGIGFGGGF